ncbi:MAG: hypothetical protein HY769_01335 [Candidatus Stahlbacteria bacterium]|nr:hypothetical protein [Candidatus Stahlbacteria bacterium]
MRKEFDAVQFQRETRKKLSKKYNVDRESFLKELKEKYGYLQSQSKRGSKNYLHSRTYA